MDNKSYSKGISWIDDCRIPFVDDGDKGSAKPQGKTTIIRNVLFNPTNDLIRTELETTQGQGRFPANILVSDDMLNDGVYHKTGIAKIPKGKNIYGGNSLLNSKTKDFGGEFGAIGEKGGSNSRYYDIDKWFENLIDG